MRKLTPALQPIIDVRTGSTTAYEALMRWQSEGELLKPHDVKPCWISTDLEMLDALIDHAGWMAQMKQRLFLNVSQEILDCDRAYKEWGCRLIDLMSCVAYPITIEVLEHTNDRVIERRWDQLKSLGVALALDDFGVELSQFDRLRKYQWDYCKFDARTLRKGESQEAARYCAGQSIVMIAEKVESEELKEVAIEYGFDQHQGFHYFQPELITQFSSVEVSA